MTKEKAAEKETQTQEAEVVMPTEDEKSLTVYGKIPKIEDEIVNEVVKVAEDTCLWVKPVTGGFALNEEVFPEIIGVLLKIDPYWVKWENNEPDKLRNINETDVPEDYEPRCDIVILSSDGAQIGVSLAKSSYRYGFAPYVKNLKTRGFEPTEVVTRFWTRDVKNQYGVFTVVRCESLETIKLIEHDKASIDNDQIPF